MIPTAAPAIARALADAVRPRRRRTVTAWAEAVRVLGPKETEPSFVGPFRGDTNPLLREIQDALMPGNGVRDVAAMLPIQMGKTLLATNVIGYYMAEEPRSVLVVLPAEASLKKWISQKLNPMFESSPALAAVIAAAGGKDAQRFDFREYPGGQLYLEHPGNVGASRLKSISVDIAIVDELDEFALSFRTGDDPIKLVEGRTSARPRTAKRLYISTPTIEGASRIAQAYEDSDQRHWHIACPACGHEQPLVWDGLIWGPDGERPTYHCAECQHPIDEAAMKAKLIPAGRWVAANPGHRRRGYTANALYYPRNLGPSWADLAAEWLAAQKDPAALKTFINDRLAQTYVDPSMRHARSNLLRERAEPYPLRLAPPWVLFVTAGVDTQDDRFELQILGHGRGGKTCTLDYAIIDGDPDLPETRAKLVDYLSQPIEHASGALLTVSATGHDMLGHRTAAVQDLCRRRLLPLHFAMFGSTRPSAPIVGRGKAVDTNYKGEAHKKGLRIYEVGGKVIKDVLYARLGIDDPAKRLVHFSADLDDAFFAGMTSEVYDPTTRMYRKKARGARNEALDTWCLAYAAACHHDVRGGGIRKWREADWDALERRIQQAAEDRRAAGHVPRAEVEPDAVDPAAPDPAPADRPAGLVNPVARPPIKIKPVRRTGGGFATSWRR